MNIARWQDSLFLAGRLLLVLIFVLSGFDKIPHYAGTAGYMAAHGMSSAMISVLLPATIAIELGGGLLIALGWQTRVLALLYVVYLIPVTLLFHVGGDTAAAVQANQIQFMKNVSIIGGMLLLAGAGAGRFSLDGRRR